MVDREIDRRLEDFLLQLMQQNVDPRQAGIDWVQFREAQREPAPGSGRRWPWSWTRSPGAKGLTVLLQKMSIKRSSGSPCVRRTIPAALRAQLEKEGGLTRLVTGLRREKAVDLALSRATMTSEIPA